MNECLEKLQEWKTYFDGNEIFDLALKNCDHQTLLKLMLESINLFNRLPTFWKLSLKNFVGFYMNLD